MESREECIRSIRSHIPYLNTSELEAIKKIMLTFAKNTTKHPRFLMSFVEWNKPVLTETEQLKADSALFCMNAMGCAISGRCGFPRYCIIDENEMPAPGSKILGVLRGDVVAIDIKKMLKVFKYTGTTLYSNSDVMDGLEIAGYMLPRADRPKTALIGKTRREVIYIPMSTLQEFIEKDVTVL